MIGAGILVIGLSLWAFKVIGGGDAKLFAAITPWIGLLALGEFLFTTAMCGLFLTIAILGFRRLPLLPVYAHAPWILRFHERSKRDLPYGVAFAAGGLLTFPQTSFYHLVFGG